MEKLEKGTEKKTAPGCMEGGVRTKNKAGKRCPREGETAQKRTGKAEEESFTRERVGRKGNSGRVGSQ